MSYCSFNISFNVIIFALSVCFSLFLMLLCHPQAVCRCLCPVEWAQVVVGVWHASLLPDGDILGWPLLLVGITSWHVTMV